MRPIEKIYWLRMVLGLLAGLLSTGYAVVSGKVSSTVVDFAVFMNGMSIALAVFLISYYAVKFRFVHDVQKPTKLLTTGIGIYFMAWLTMWVLTYTLLALGFI